MICCQCSVTSFRIGIVISLRERALNALNELSLLADWTLPEPL